MNYDDWKLETPENEYARQHGHPCLCPECSEAWEEDIYGHCVNCDAKLTRNCRRCAIQTTRAMRSEIDD